MNGLSGSKFLAVANHLGGLVVLSGKRGISPRPVRGLVGRGGFIGRMLMCRGGNLVRTRVCPRVECVKGLGSGRVGLLFRGVVFGAVGYGLPVGDEVGDLSVHDGRFGGGSLGGVVEGGKIWVVRGGLVSIMEGCAGCPMRGVGSSASVISGLRVGSLGCVELLNRVRGVCGVRFASRSVVGFTAVKSMRRCVGGGV